MQHATVLDTDRPQPQLWSLVIGAAASTIGTAMCHALAARRRAVALVGLDRDESALNETADVLCSQHGVPCEVIVVGTGTGLGLGDSFHVPAPGDLARFVFDRCMELGLVINTLVNCPLDMAYTTTSTSISTHYSACASADAEISVGCAAGSPVRHGPHQHGAVSAALCSLFLPELQQECDCDGIHHDQNACYSSILNLRMLRGVDIATETNFADEDEATDFSGVNVVCIAVSGYADVFRIHHVSVANVAERPEPESESGHGHGYRRESMSSDAVAAFACEMLFNSN